MRTLRQLLNEESGQATVEYVLMVAIAVGFALLVIREFIQPVFARLTHALAARMENAFFGNFHHFPVR